MKLALLLLLAISRPVVLVDDVYQIPAGQWRWVPFALKHQLSTLECRAQTMGPGEVRLELIHRSDLDLLFQHKSYDSLISTADGATAAFNQYIDEPGEYAVVIENPGKDPVAARLTVAMSFGQSAARYLSHERQLTVILVSFALFFTIVTFSARALLRAMKNRPGQQ